MRQVHKVSVKKKMNWKPVIITAIAVCAAAGAVFAGLQYQKQGESYQLSVSDKALSTNVSGATKNGYFKYLLSKTGASSAVDEAYYDLAEKVVSKKEYKNYVEAQLKSAKSSYKTYKKLFKAYGVSSKEEYIKKYVHNDAYKYLMKNKYLTENQKTLRTKYNLIYVKTASFSSEKKAKAFIKKGDDSSMLTHDVMLSNIATSGIDSALKYKIFKVTDYKKDGFVSKPLKYKKKYYVLFVENSKRKAKLIAQDVIKIDADKKFDAIAKKYYLKKYHFTVTDRKLKKAIEKKKLL